MNVLRMYVRPSRPGDRNGSSNRRRDVSPGLVLGRRKKRVPVGHINLNLRQGQGYPVGAYRYHFDTTVRALLRKNPPYQLHVDTVILPD